MRGKVAIILLAVMGLFVSISAKAQDIVVGAALPLSGAYASYGEDEKMGLELALKQINAKGVLGRKLRLEMDDTLTDRAKAAAIFQKFASQPEVVAILSHSTIEFLALDPLATALKMPHISIGSAGPMNKIGPYSFRVFVVVDKVTPNALRQLQELKGVKSLSIIYETTNNYSVGEMEVVKASAKKLGIDVRTVESFVGGDQNFTLQLTRIAQTNPDLFVVSAATNEAVPIIIQTRSMGIKALIYGGTALNDPHIGKQAGKAALGMITYFPFDSKDQRPIVQEFMRLYKERTGSSSVPSGHMAYAYDTIHLLADALRRAGSTDREAVRVALGTTQNFEGLNGKFRYSGSGDNLEQNPHLFEWTDNGFRRLTP